MLAFAAVMATNVLTKGLIGLVFPIAFVLLYLALTGRLRDLARLHLPAAGALFLPLAAPWHLLAALRNPPIPLPPGLGLPAHGGWAWFYLYNEHIARFLSRRIPHDYGQTPVWLFWLFLALWAMPWTAFVPGALAHAIRTLRTRVPPLQPNIFSPPRNRVLPSPESRDLPTPQNRVIPTEGAAAAEGPASPAPDPTPYRQAAHATNLPPTPQNRVIPTEGAAAVEGPASPAPAPAPDPAPRAREAALALLLWPAVILGFFTLSARQEYYSLPAIPALALLAGGLLARADRSSLIPGSAALHPTPQQNQAARSALAWSLYLLVPLCTLTALLAAWFAITAPHPARGTDLATLLASNPDAYNLSLGHLLDLTGAAMGLFRAPLACVSLTMLALGPAAWLLRRRGRTYAANLTLAAAMTALLLCTHAGLTRFYPILGSKPLALAILRDQHLHPRSNDLILIDGELTAGSTLLFYTRQPVHLVNGRVNGPWYGSFWPDSPNIFETDTTLHQLWSTPRRLFLLTYNPAARTRDLAPFGAVHPLATSGGKTILTNH